MSWVPEKSDYPLQGGIKCDKCNGVTPPSLIFCLLADVNYMITESDMSSICKRFWPGQ